LISITVNAQSLIEKIKENTCNCITENPDIQIEEFLECLKFDITEFEKEIQAMIDPDSELSEYDQGVILGENIMFDLQSTLIHNCDAYYKFFIKLKEPSMVPLKDNYPLKAKDSLNKLISKNKTAELLFERGNYYYSNNKLRKAEKNYLNCLSIDPNYVLAKFYLGSLYEKKENYTKAIKLYQELIDETGKREFIIYMEIAKRKSLN